MTRIAIRPDGSWWDVDECGAEGDCDDVLRVEVPDEMEPDDIDSYAYRMTNAPDAQQ